MSEICKNLNCSNYNEEAEKLGQTCNLHTPQKSTGLSCPEEKKEIVDCVCIKCCKHFFSTCLQAICSECQAPPLCSYCKKHPAKTGSDYCCKQCMDSAEGCCDTAPNKCKKCGKVARSDDDYCSIECKAADPNRHPVQNYYCLDCGQPIPANISFCCEGCKLRHKPQPSLFQRQVQASEKSVQLLESILKELHASRKTLVPEQPTGASSRPTIEESFIRVLTYLGNIRSDINIRQHARGLLTAISDQRKDAESISQTFERLRNPDRNKCSTD